MISLLLAPTAKLIPTAEVATSFSAPQLLFFAFAGITIFGAVFMILQKNDVAAVMSLVATFFGLAAVYTFLSAHFIAVLQVLVYAGAIMVLFIFVVMVLNRDETDPWVWRGLVGKIFLGAAPMLYVVYKLGRYLKQVPTTNAGAPSADFGTVGQIGELLFTDYLFAFEAISVLLLIAVIAAVVVARAPKAVEEHAPHREPHADHGHDAASPAQGHH